MDKEQLRIIAENSPREAAKKLDLHISKIRYYRRKLNMENQSGRTHEWTEEEDRHLLSFAENSTYSELQKVIRATRSQISYRCKTLGISPRRSKYRTALTEEEKEVCLTDHLDDAAEKLGVTTQTIKRHRRTLIETDFYRFDAPVSPTTRPTRSLIDFSFRDEQATPMWTSEDDRLLIKRVVANSFDEVAKLFGKSREEIRERLQFLLKEEKAKTSINEILFRFQGMTDGQIHQMKLIYSHDPKSAVRYCEAIRDARKRTRTAIAEIRSDE